MLILDWVHDLSLRSRRTRGKTDAVDAESAARAVLSGRAPVIAKTGDGHVEALRLLKMVRDTAINARTKSINQLKAILVTADPALRETVTGLGPATLIRRCAELPDPADDAGVAAAAVIHTLRVLAERILRLKAEAYEIEKCMTALVASHAPELVTAPPGEDLCNRCQRGLVDGGEWPRRQNQNLPTRT
jgi:transposase